MNQWLRRKKSSPFYKDHMMYIFKKKKKDFNLVSDNFLKKFQFCPLRIRR